MKPKIILIGGGGHCKSSIDVIEQIGEFAIAGIVDKNQSIENLFGYPLLGNDENLSKLKEIYEYALITMGQINTPSIRMKLFEYTKSIGFKFPSIISNKAYVSKHAQISEGTIIMHGALINAGAVVGKNCIINTNALIEHDVIVGDRTIDVHIRKLREKLGDDFIIFQSIAKFVQDGTYIEMVGEDGDKWRWLFKNGICKEIYPIITWED
jgi:sugar O-acyltransferase (sialic acid O-acetyltransferase NeuD family)